MGKRYSGQLYFLPKTKAKFILFRTFCLQNSSEQAESNKVAAQHVLQYRFFEGGCFQIVKEKKKNL